MKTPKQTEVENFGRTSFVTHTTGLVERIQKAEQEEWKPDCFGTYPINPICFKCMVCDYQKRCYEAKND